MNESAPRSTLHEDWDLRKNRLDTKRRLPNFRSVAYEFTGIVKKIFPEQTFPSGFAKREIVLTSQEDRYPQDVVFEFVKEKMSELESVKEGEEVTISFDLKGREYNGRYFVNLGGWRLRKGAKAAPSAADTPPDDYEPEDTGDYSDDDPIF